MDLELESVNLPEYFTSLLNLDLMARDKAYKNYLMGIENSKSLDILIKKYFTQSEKSNSSLQSVLNGVGGLGLRDKLASIFIAESTKGEWPLAPEHMFISEVLLFEDNLKDITVSGVSRSFLLGFYLALLQIQKGEVFRHDDYLSKDFLSLLKFGRGRVVKVDWLILAFFHFNEFIGNKECTSLLKKGLNYNDFYKLLNEEQIRIMNDNFLSYGHSIGDQDIFTSEFVE